MRRAALSVTALVCMFVALTPLTAHSQTPTSCSVTLTVQPQPQVAGKPLLLVASVTGCRNAQFEFYELSRYVSHQRPGTPQLEQVIQLLSDRSTAVWTPDVLPNTRYEAGVEVRSDDGEASARTTFTMSEPGIDWRPLLPLLAVLPLGLGLGVWQVARWLRYPRQDSNLRPSV